MINFLNLTVQEVDTILAGLRKLPMELVAELHAKLHQDATTQWQALQAKEAEKVPAEVSPEAVA